MEPLERLPAVLHSPHLEPALHRIPGVDNLQMMLVDAHLLVRVAIRGDAATGDVLWPVLRLLERELQRAGVVVQAVTVQAVRD